LKLGFLFYLFAYCIDIEYVVEKV